MSAEKRIPDILLERYRLNELPKDQADRLTAQLAQDLRLQERLAALEASDQALRRDGVTDRLEQGTLRKLAENASRSRRSSMFWALPVAAAAIVGIAVAARTSVPPFIGSAGTQP